MLCNLYFGKYPNQDGVHLDLSCPSGNRISKVKIPFGNISALCNALINADIPYVQVKAIRRCLTIGRACECDQIELRHEDLACLGVANSNSQFVFSK
jgi:hypothetical protein